jgi:hypothetical protein
MRFTLPKFVLASAIAATAVLATNSALAERLVNVPFNFTVNGKVCPAGLYSLDHNQTTGIVTLRNTDWKSSFTWVAGPGEPAPTDSRVILSFDENGQDHVLRTVQYGNLITARLDGKHKQTEGRPARVVLGQ